MSTSLRAAYLRCEYLVNPLGIDVAKPRLSWELQSDTNGQKQTAYQIQAASSLAGLQRGRADLWDSGQIDSNATCHIEYKGKPLTSGQTAWWRVRVWDKDGNGTESDIASWEMGLVRKNDWQAEWIGHRQVTTDALSPAPLFRRAFNARKQVKRARLYATARGIYEFYVNGQRAGDAIFPPGWTDYRIRIQYQTYDVTSMMQSGENVIGAWLGTGWYAGHIGFTGQSRHYGAEPMLLAQLHLEYADGSKEIILTDEQWKTSNGPILYSDFLAGEFYDSRKELIGWNDVNYDDSTWQAVFTAPRDNTALVADCSQPARAIERLKPFTVKPLDSNTQIVDMGQNMVGWVRLGLRGKAGTKIQLRYAEMLNKDGSIYTESLRSAKATDTYIVKGGPRETFEPRFTFHGFRYVEVTGYPGPLKSGDITGIVVHSDTPKVGSFECSHPMVNQLQRNIEWSQRGNYLSVPTDCPQRDERMGWLGDAGLFIRTASHNMDVAAFFTKWMQDIEDAQSPEGGFPDVAPRVVDPMDGAPAWGDAGIIIPWVMYRQYGDTRIIRKHWDAMAKWMGYLAEANPNYLRINRLNNNFGDWLAIAADTPKDVLATAYWAYDVLVMSKMAAAVGKRSETKHFAELFERIRSAFLTTYVDGDGKIKGDTQTGYVLALHFQLLPTDEMRGRAVQHLLNAIRVKREHLSTGIVGVSALLPVLSESCNTSTAYKLLLNDTFPSWGHSIKHGATTIWERWDGWTAENGFQSPAMNSFNHYALGSVGEWLYRYLAGIDLDPDVPGYERLLIRPRIRDGIMHAGAELRSIRGKICSAWEVKDGTVTLKLTLPPNTTAQVMLPNGNGRVNGLSEGATLVGTDDGTAVLEVDSGSYVFRSKP